MNSNKNNWMLFGYGEYPEISHYRLIIENGCLVGIQVDSDCPKLGIWKAVEIEKRDLP